MSQHLWIGLSSIALAVGCSHEKDHNTTTASAGESTQSSGYAQGNAEISGTAPILDNGSASAPIATSTPPSAGIACPMEIAGTHVYLRDVSDGIALDFVTTGDVQDLRHRVRQLAQGPSETTMSPGGAGDEQGSGGREMKPEVTQPEVQSQVSDLATGARVTFAPHDLGQLGVLRAQVQVQASRLENGDCAGVAINGISLGRSMKANRVPPTAVPVAPEPVMGSGSGSGSGSP